MGKINKEELEKRIQVAYSSNAAETGCYSFLLLIIAIFLGIVGFVIYKADGAGTDNVGSYFCLISSACLIAVLIFGFITSKKSMDKRDDFLNSSDKSLIHPSINPDNTLSDDDVLTMVSEDEIVYKHKKIIITDNYIVSLAGDPFIITFKSLKAAYRDIHDKNILVKKRDYELRTAVLVYEDSNALSSICFDSQKEFIEFMGVLSALNIDLYAGINSYKDNEKLV